MNPYHMHEYAKRIVLNTPPLRALYRMLPRKSKDKARVQLQTDGLRMTADVCAALDEAGVSNFVACGSLLGLVRDGNFIKHDTDIDFAIVLKSQNDWEIIQQSLTSHGYTLIHYFTFNNEIVEQAYRYGDLSFDVFSFVECGDKLRMYSFVKHPNIIYDSSSDCSATYFEFSNNVKTIRKVFGNHEINVPADAEHMLEVWYGKDWQVPDPNWVNGKYAKAIDSPHAVLHVIK